MKLFLIIILFAIFVLIAIFVYLFYMYKSKLFNDLEYVAKYLKNNISFNKNNLNILLSDSFEDINISSKYILKNASKPISKMFLNGNKNLLNDFYKSLGKGDVSFEINNLNYYINIFEDLNKKSKDDIKNKGMLYFKLIIGLGLMICILLI